MSVVNEYLNGRSNQWMYMMFRHDDLEMSIQKTTYLVDKYVIKIAWEILFENEFYNNIQIWIIRVLPLHIGVCHMFCWFTDLDSQCIKTQMFDTSIRYCVRCLAYWRISRHKI